MRDQIDVLLDKVDDPALRKELLTEVERLRSKRSFGLVFESHLPERVRLPDHPVRIGGSVVLRDDPESPTYEVVSLAGGDVTMTMVRDGDGSSLAPADERRAEVVAVPRGRVVVIADFGAPIHPGLRLLGSVARGGDKPSHVVIKGENHHVLEALQFTHAGKVDCIYIDPPYNTGARDWKYDNNYIDDTDNYRHSKWLAFMERRLLLAKKLLNPDDSVLIITIDEKEVHRLGMLLDQVFAGVRIQMVDTLINPAGGARSDSFGRSDEYMFFVMIGVSAPQRVQLPREWITAKGRTHTGNVRWDLLRRSGQNNAARADRPALFYPLYIDPSVPRIVEIGQALGADEHEAPRIGDLVALLPIRQDGREGNWQASPATLRKRIDEGRVRVTGDTSRGFTISVLKDGEYKKIMRGEFEITGYRDDGSLIVADADSDSVTIVPSTQWRVPGHDATQYGSRMLNDIIPGRRFPFPKSLYAVEDAVRFFAKDKPNAVVLDFFGGSGTTTHAVARLNRQDRGRRQSILVTNNEVSADEAKALREQGLHPGDPEWEALGIFEHITRPRIEAAITGVTPSGEPVKADYKFTDEFPMADGFGENVEFCELTYLDPDDVELDLAFDALAPLLWLRAGAQGPILDESSSPFAWTERYGVLFVADRWRAFVAARPESATTAFVVTDSPSLFAGIASELPDHLDVVRLYESYLTTFASTGGG